MDRVQKGKVKIQMLSQSCREITNNGNLKLGYTTLRCDGDKASVESTHDGATHWSAMLEDIGEL